jgi:hypothetical protein
MDYLLLGRSFDNEDRMPAVVPLVDTYEQSNLATMS